MNTSQKNVGSLQKVVVCMGEKEKNGKNKISGNAQTKQAPGSVCETKSEYVKYCTDSLLVFVCVKAILKTLDP